MQTQLKARDIIKKNTGLLGLQEEYLPQYQRRYQLMIIEKLYKFYTHL